MENKEFSLKKTARKAGLLYFVWVLTGIYGMMYVQSQTIVKGDDVATASKILSNEFLFRTSIINDLFSSAVCVFLVFVLYRLLKQVNEHQAKLMVSLLILTIPVVFIINAFNITSLMILKGEGLKTFEAGQKQELAMLFLKINDYGLLILEMFWGLWLIPFGQLVYKSRFIPRILGIFLIIGGVVYMLDSFLSLLFPMYRLYFRQFAEQPILLTVAVGEISIMLWLLIKGVKKNASKIAIKEVRGR